MAAQSIRLTPGELIPASGNPNQPLLNKLVEIDCHISQLVDILNNPSNQIGDIVTTKTMKSNIMPFGSVMVATTVTTIRNANPNRISILLRNIGADNLYIGPDQSVTVDTGMEIRPNESWESDTWNGPLYGVSDGATLDIRYQEESL